MGSVGTMLSREGEIAIPSDRASWPRGHDRRSVPKALMTFRLSSFGRDELNDGRILLRDIIDLEATYEVQKQKPSRLPKVCNRQTVRNP